MNAQKKRKHRQTIKTVRCAMYTRKNIDAGHPGEFNSIRAQRKAIRAFVASRRSQGWILLRKKYEDIGQSAIALKRPAFQELLADMNAGKVDCVIIHTFDRLTRSLSDMTMLLDQFQRCGVTLATVCPTDPFALERMADVALLMVAPTSRRT